MEASPTAPRLRFASFAEAVGAVEPGEVRVWVVPLATPPFAEHELLPHLTADERARADRYKVQKARHQFVTTRGLLRRLLGTALGVAPADVPIPYTEAGKPVLAESAARPDFHFNVTHTDGLALLAAADRPVGIDVERVRAVADADGLVGRFFSPAECAAFRALPADLRPAGFFRGWTSKEAVIKAAGISVTCLEEFDVELHPSRPAAVLAARHAALAGWDWALAAWEPTAGFAAAVALVQASETRPGQKED
jgi:4'-phosphopantetheinyl transferase